ncbi:hypothetical protein [Rhodoferax sp.]|uniref:hypothetical protein n=1 Tax=Rhodoferax sp. TaxID=50421 RepID=UPI001A0FA048|nr:hypothetical protein [Rhodoferax sp.]MBE0475234.1 hypothetical protein [Rhodoferax sp.]
MNATSPLSQAYYPACFSDASQYQQWRAAARKAKAGASDYCTDCTREYQREMIKQSRCAHPKTRFFVDCDGFTEGRRPINERLFNDKTKGRR